MYPQKNSTLVLGQDANAAPNKICPSRDRELARRGDSPLCWQMPKAAVTWHLPKGFHQSKFCVGYLKFFCRVM